MTIEYTYEIIKVDEAARCMEVVYKAPGRQTMHVGARLPFVGESLELVIQEFAPVPYWLALEAPVVIPTVGVTGTIASQTVTDADEAAALTAEQNMPSFAVDEVIV